jgi:hypothetical protein
MKPRDRAALLKHICNPIFVVLAVFVVAGVHPGVASTPTNTTDGHIWSAQDGEWEQPVL